MKPYIDSLIAEYWKFGHTWSAVIWLVTPILLITGSFIALFLNDASGYYQYVAFSSYENPWYYLYQSYGYIQFLIWPLLTILLATSLINQELKSEMWRSCPVVISRQLWSKWVFMALLIALGLLLGWVCCLTGVYVLSVSIDLPFSSFEQDTAYMTIRFVQLYPAILAVGTLHFWVSLYSRGHILLNISLPLLALPLGSYAPYGLLYQWWRLHSYYLDGALDQKWSFWSNQASLWPTISSIAFLMIIILHIIGYFTFKKKQSWILSR